MPSRPLTEALDRLILELLLISESFIHAKWKQMQVNSGLMVVRLKKGQVEESQGSSL